MFKKPNEKANATLSRNIHPSSSVFFKNVSNKTQHIPKKIIISPVKKEVNYETLASIRNEKENIDNIDMINMYNSVTNINNLKIINNKSKFCDNNTSLNINEMALASLKSKESNSYILLLIL